MSSTEYVTVILAALSVSIGTAMFFIKRFVSETSDTLKRHENAMVKMRLSMAENLAELKQVSGELKLKLESELIILKTQLNGINTNIASIVQNLEFAKTSMKTVNELLDARERQLKAASDLLRNHHGRIEKIEENFGKIIYKPEGKK